MLHLFRRKIIYVVKYFLRNHFSEKMIFLKIFFGVWLARKNHQGRKTESGNFRSPSPDSSCTSRNPARFVRLQTESG
jgi:hypothetical protein